MLRDWVVRRGITGWKAKESKLWRPHGNLSIHPLVPYSFFLAGTAIFRRVCWQIALNGINIGVYFFVISMLAN